MRHSIAVFIFLCVAFFCGGCGMSDSFGAAKSAVIEFHSRMNAEQYDAIYDAADPAFRQALNREAAHNFFSLLHGKFGNYGSATTTNLDYNTTTEGRFVNMNCTATYNNGAVQEEFKWKINGGKAQLYNYNANSPLLLSK